MDPARLPTLEQFIAEVRSTRGDRAGDLVKELAGWYGLKPWLPLEPQTMNSLLTAAGLSPSDHSLDPLD